MSTLTPVAEATATRLIDHLRELRRDDQHDAARAILADALAQRPHDQALSLLSWEHASFWWQPLSGPRATLRRRGPDDVATVRECWADAEFMRRFNQMAAALPAADGALDSMLRREQAAIISETPALHWTIEVAGRKLGFVSVVNISRQHRRAEFLIGVRGPCSPWTGPEAAHLVLGFLASKVGIERLTAYFYPENQSAIVAACKLGFAVEGTLRSDLVVAGLSLESGYFERTARIRRRLLGDQSTANNA